MAYLIQSRWISRKTANKTLDFLELKSRIISNRVDKSFLLSNILMLIVVGIECRLGMGVDIYLGSTSALQVISVA